MINRKELIDDVLPTRKYGCYFRLVELEDAEFILSLRNDERLSRYINETSNKLEDQINWLKEYKKREAKGTDFYIICLSNDNKIRYGLNRIYDIKSEDFEFGSWLYAQDYAKDNAVLGHLYSISIAFEVLNLKLCRASIRKKNKSVLRFMKSYNPALISEDELSYYFTFDYNNWNKRRKELLKILGYSK
jgi:RimJ/RimL family protein N-acetyltransferase